MRYLLILVFVILFHLVIWHGIPAPESAAGYARAHCPEAATDAELQECTGSEY